jgi:hypothetical protein
LRRTKSGVNRRGAETPRGQKKEEREDEEKRRGKDR